LAHVQIACIFPSPMAKPNNLSKVPQRQYSPDDIKSRLLEAAARDTRTEAEKWLGDPPPERSALAAKLSRPALRRRARDIFPEE
jgi:hypothetical protein